MRTFVFFLVVVLLSLAGPVGAQDESLGDYSDTATATEESSMDLGEIIEMIHNGEEFFGEITTGEYTYTIFAPEGLGAWSYHSEGPYGWFFIMFPNRGKGTPPSFWAGMCASGESHSGTGTTGFAQACNPQEG